MSLADFGKKIVKLVFGGRRLGAFNGVFVPTFLTIIGVILYLRMGFIVGSVGVLNTVFIVLLSVSVTLATALSLSSITTTIRIGTGGAYSIISKTLGLEVGGSVGLPLAFAQIFSVVFYILGFSEAWRFVFPGHSVLVVSYVVWAVLFGLTFVGLKAAVKVQVLVFFMVLASLVSIFAGGGSWWLSFFEIPELAYQSSSSFWQLFALFFPAVTGLMAGIGLSGNLTDPKKQIPRGVLWAVFVTSVIYLLMSVWLGKVIPIDDLLNDNLAVFKYAAFPSLVTLGILAATFSSALTTFVAAPRLLQALAASSSVPMSNFFMQGSLENEPRNGTFFAALIVLLSITFGSLDTIAPLLTMFFLITYGMINLAVFTELALGLVSFRPTLKISKFVPLYGFLGSIIFMFLINPLVGILALSFLLGIYLWLIRRNLQQREGDVRSGLLVAFAEWAAKKTQTLPESTKHNWKPNVLVPVVITRTLLGNFPLIRAIAYPNGSMTVLGVNLKKGSDAPDANDLTKESIEQELDEMPAIVKKFGRDDLFTSSSIIDCDDYTEGVTLALQAFESQVFHPNVLFLPFKAERLPKRSLKRIFDVAAEEKVGVIIFDRDEDLGLGSQEDVHIWIDPEVLENEFYDDRRFDLAMLVGYKLYLNWKAKLHVWICVKDEQKDSARSYLKKLIYEARFPSSVEIHVSTDSFSKTMKEAPAGDLHVIPVKDGSVDFISKIAKANDRSFLFVSDSTQEDVLA